MKKSPKSRIYAVVSASCVLAASVSQAATINEIRTDQTGADNQEYFELAGTSGESLNGLSFLAIGDGAGASGVVESVTGLTGSSIPADGFFLAVEGDLFPTSPPFSSDTPDLSPASNALNFENSDNITFLLVNGFTGALNDDLDTNDDGVLDTTPWTSIVDSVAIVIDPTFTTSERVYSSTVVGPDGAFAPGHVFRFPNGSGTWFVGDFDGVPVYQDTPGRANVPEPTSLLLMLMSGFGIVRHCRSRR